MEVSDIWTAGIFVHLALLFYVLGFLVRDELILRGMILTGTAFYILYYYFAADTPLWDAIFASVVIGTVNAAMIIVIIRERSTIGMSPEMLRLYQLFETLTPGQFRRIMRCAQWRVAGEDERLCEQGVAPEYLYFIAEGEMTLTKDARSVRTSNGAFVGEIAFLLKGVASASVDLDRGTEYVRWPHTDLRRMMRKSPALSNALTALFNRDLARKLSASMRD